MKEETKKRELYEAYMKKKLAPTAGTAAVADKNTNSAANKK